MRPILVSLWFFLITCLATNAIAQVNRDAEIQRDGNCLFLTKASAANPEVISKLTANPFVLDKSKYSSTTIEFATNKQFKKVEFYLNGKFKHSEGLAPYFITLNEPDRLDPLDLQDGLHEIRVVAHEASGAKQEISGTIQVGQIGPIKGVLRFTAQVSSREKKSLIEIRSGSVSGKILGRLEVPALKDYEKYQALSCNLSDISDVNELFLVFKGIRDDLLNVDSFTIEGVSNDGTKVEIYREAEKGKKSKGIQFFGANTITGTRHGRGIAGSIGNNDWLSYQIDATQFGGSITNNAASGERFAIYLIKAGISQIVKLKQIQDGETVDISSFGDVSILYEQDKMKTVAFYANGKWINGGSEKDHLATKMVNGVISPFVFDGEAVEMGIHGEYVTGEFLRPTKNFKLIKKRGGERFEAARSKDDAIYLIKAGVSQITKLKQIQDGEEVDVSSYGDFSILYEDSRSFKHVDFYLNNKYKISQQKRDFIATEKKGIIIQPFSFPSNVAKVEIRRRLSNDEILSNHLAFVLTKQGSLSTVTNSQRETSSLSTYNWSEIKGGDGKVKIESLSSSDLNAKDVLELVFAGPGYKANSSFNPYLDLDLEVVFTHKASGKKVIRPIYFAADGNAKETNAKEGDVWKTKVVLPEPGEWNWKISALGGSGIRALDTREGTKLKAYEGKTGSIRLKSKNRSSGDALGKGELQYVGKHYLKFSSGAYYLKNAIAAPTTLLGSSDFSDTANNGVFGMTRHARDWRSKDPLWQKSKGKDSVGAINYLSNSGINAISFVLDTRGMGKGNIYPYQSQHDVTRFSSAKLEQWEVLFDHALKQGMVIEFVISDESVSSRENTYTLDFGKFGKEYRVLCRELVARYGHYPNVIWNLGLGNKLDVRDQLELGEYVRTLLGAEKHLTIGVTKDRQNIIYPRLMNTSEVYSGVSIQTDWFRANKTVEEWVGRTESETTPWVVNVDRVEPLTVGIMPQSLRGDSQATPQDLRGGYLWGTLLSGGSGFTHYFGSKGEESQENVVDFRSRDVWWESCRVVLNFFEKYLPFSEMKAANELIGNRRGRKDKGYCFAKADDVYAIYVPNGQKVPELDLKSATLGFEVRWYDPRSGGGLQKGSVTSVDSGGKVNLGKPPFGSRNDWVVLVTKGNKVKGGVSIK